MIFEADFETTTDPNDCHVWVWGMAEVGNVNWFKWGTTLDDFFETMRELCEIEPCTIYFHNEKFDIQFIFVWLFEHGFTHNPEKRYLRDNQFSTLISDKGVYYSATIMFKYSKTRNETVKLTINDSLKKLPLSVKELAEGFRLPMKKGEIDYNKPRPIGYIPDTEELSYLKNDVDIVSVALKSQFDNGMKQMTQGKDALVNYQTMIGKKNFDYWFPVLEYDADIRKAYKGAYTYLKPEHIDVDIGRGITFDNNSIYPHVMRNKPMPFGHGVPFNGEYEPDDLYPLYIQQLQCNFELKPGYLPTIQIKKKLEWFSETEYLSSSDDHDVLMSVTNVDLEIIKEHYNLYNVEYINGWKFKASTEMFVEYVDYWSGQKIMAKTEGNYALYWLSKWMLNKLYGKFATNPNCRSRYPYYENGVIKYRAGPKETRKPVYIPVGAFTTAWARSIEISAAQANYDRFIYGDTDSIHLIGEEIPTTMEISDTKLGAWKHEATFDKARFLRQKSYIENVISSEKDVAKFLEKNPHLAHHVSCENGIYRILHVTCAGLSNKGHAAVTWDNFHPGVEYKDVNFKQTAVVGGVILKPTDFSVKGGVVA